MNKITQNRIYQLQMKELREEARKQLEEYLQAIKLEHEASLKASLDDTIPLVSNEDTGDEDTP